MEENCDIEKTTQATPQESKGNNTFGRKVFFINSSRQINSNIVDYLRNEEYETYVIDDYKSAKTYLRMNPDSICFFYIDTQLSKNGWFNFIKSFEEDEILKSQYIGVVTEKIDNKTRDKYLSGLNIRSGLITLDESIENILGGILSTLEALNAKGRRKYVRAKITIDKDSYILWTVNNKMFKFPLLDISSVGMAVDIPEQAMSIVKPNLVMNSVTLKIGSKEYPISVVIYVVKQIPDGNLGILLITSADDKAKRYIKQYVANTLQIQLYHSIGAATPDTKDYEAKKTNQDNEG